MAFDGTFTGSFWSVLYFIGVLAVYIAVICIVFSVIYYLCNKYRQLKAKVITKKKLFQAIVVEPLSCMFDWVICFVGWILGLFCYVVFNEYVGYIFVSILPFALLYIVLPIYGILGVASAGAIIGLVLVVPFVVWHNRTNIRKACIGSCCAVLVSCWGTSMFMFIAIIIASS